MGRLRSGAVLVVLGLGLAMPVVTSPPPAASQTPSGSFACRATPLNVLGLEPVVANAATLPCAPDRQGISDLSVGGVGVGALVATTGLQPGARGAFSRTLLGALDLLAIAGLRADLVEAEARIECEEGLPRARGTSRVIGLTVNGAPVDSTAPADIPLAVGTLHLNQTVVIGTAVTTRAVSLELGSASVILGEARAEALGNPCSAAADGTITIVKRSHPESSQAFSFEGDLGSFSLRDPRGPAADSRTFSVPPGRYTVREPRVSRGPAATNWEIQAINCSGGHATVDPRARTLVVDVQAGQHVTCTFNNFNGVLAATDGIDNPTTGIDPVAAKRAPDSLPSPGAVVTPPTEMGGGDGAGGDRTGGRLASPPVGDERDTGGSSAISASTLAFVGLPLLAVIGGGIWFLLAAGRRRREGEEAR